jgi:hypothetical protein
MMELSVLIEPIAADGYRASCGEPIPTSAEGVTRDEALGRLRERIEARVRGGAEVVRLRIDVTRPPAVPVWPDDDLTRDWLAGIAAARTAADTTPDRWDEAGDDRP